MNEALRRLLAAAQAYREAYENQTRVDVQTHYAEAALLHAARDQGLDETGHVHHYGGTSDLCMTLGCNAERP